MFENLPPIRLLKQQHLPDGKRWPKKATPPEPPPMLGHEWTQHPIYGPVRRQVPHQPLTQINTFQPKLQSIRELVQEARARRDKSRKDQLTVGNLLFQDYRFFVGVKREDSFFSRCRACRQVLYGVKARREHHEKRKCSRWLVDAFKVLNRTKDAIAKLPSDHCECVICGKTLEKEGKWGVPICTTQKSCLERWMFDEECPSAALTGALVLVYPSLKDYMEKNVLEWERENAKG